MTFGDGELTSAGRFDTSGSENSRRTTQHNQIVAMDTESGSTGCPANGRPRKACARHRDCIRDLLAKPARQAGLTATTEHAMFVPDQIMPDGQPAPGSVRPTHRADAHIIEPAGSELWLDVIDKIPRRPRTSPLRRNFSEKKRPNAGHMASVKGTTFRL